MNDDLKGIANRKKQNVLMWTMLIIALVQMPALALTPAIHLIQTQAFPEKTLAQVQTVMGLSNLVWPLTSIVVAFLINRGKVTKKGAVVFGLVLLFVTGIFALLQHTFFWNLIALSVLLGISCGGFVTNAFGLLFDNFDDETRQKVAGYQTSSINLGGILFSLAGGVLATMIWYGGYLILLLGLPVAVLAFITVPYYKSPSAKISGDYTEKSKLNPRIFYYAAIAFLFMMIYAACGANISTHIDKLGNSATSGILVAVQMGGGVVSGLFFGRLSDKFGDMVMVFACTAVFIGYLFIGLFSSSLVMITIGIFLAGTSLSIMLPRCIYSVSTLVDKSNSATATVIISSIAPSLGGFLSPIVFTNLTVALAGESTVFRYLFLSGVVLVFGLTIALLTHRRTKKEKALAA